MSADLSGAMLALETAVRPYVERRHASARGEELREALAGLRAEIGRQRLIDRVRGDAPAPTTVELVEQLLRDARAAGVGWHDIVAVTNRLGEGGV